MKRKNSFLVLCCCGIAATLVAFTAFAATVSVGPTDPGGIEGAITAAGVPGTVNVDPGTYSGDANTELVVQDGVTVQSTSGAYTTTINCGGYPYAFRFELGQGPSAVVRGFTIRDASNAAILCNTGSPTIDQCIMTQSDATQAGGIYSVNSSPLISDCNIEHNRGFRYGGAYFEGGSPTITRTRISYNTADWAGGIYSGNSSPSISDCNIENNVADGSWPYAGGAVFFGGSPSVTGGSISWNSAFDIGGISNFDSPGSLTMTGVAVTYNTGYWTGGIEAVDSSPIITNCTIDHNWAWGSDIECVGGARFVGGSPTITGGSFSYNTAWRPFWMGGPSGGTGGIFNEDSPDSLTMTGVSVNYNTGFMIGGISCDESSPDISGGSVSFNSGMMVGGIAGYDSDAEISDVTITSNSAWGELGVDFPPFLHPWSYTVGGMSFIGGSPTISGGTVTFNSAWGGTGGIYCAQELFSPTISGVTVSDNRGGLAGGITFLDASGTIEDCIVTRNVGTGCDSSDCHTGGILVMDGSDSADVSVTNSIINGNTGLVGGIGVLGVPEILLTNCTIADNPGDEVGGIGSMGDPAITILNSILWGNTPSQVDTVDPPTVTYSDVEGGHAGTGNINANPVFIGGGDYHLTPVASPCIDAATATGAPNDDIDGDFRPQGAGIDMGADEALPDDDGDGVPSVYEMGPPDAPNPGYDGNGDLVPDFMQGNVASFPTVDGQSYVTIACPAPAFFTHVKPGPNPSPGDTPEGVTFPLGFFSFMINNVGPGGAVTVTLLLPEAPIDYWKYGRTPSNPANHWYKFDYNGTTGAQRINSTTTTLDFVDGLRGDNDLLANGIIVDPVGPAVQAPVAGVEDDDDEAFIGDDSGCFIGTLAN